MPARRNIRYGADEKEWMRLTRIFFDLYRAAPGGRTIELFHQLSDRQRDYLRQVFQHRNSQEIAFAAIPRVSARAVDKQLGLAKDIIGVTSRFEAARLFAEYEAGVEGFYPASVAPSKPAFWPLPLPVPTKARSTNSLTWQQVLAWGAIIAIAAPVAITVAAMLIIALALLFGVHL